MNTHPVKPLRANCAKLSSLQSHVTNFLLKEGMIHPDEQEDLYVIRQRCIFRIGATLESI